MNSLDQRLYHYEYRRQRPNNPTYNSNNVFSSINMLTPIDYTPSQIRSNGRYSLGKNESIMMNNSEIVSSRAAGNYSRILPFLQIPRKNPILSDKDSLYLQMIGERNQNRSMRNHSEYDRKVSSSIENIQNKNDYTMNGEDSLTNKVKQFQKQRR